MHWVLKDIAAVSGVVVFAGSAALASVGQDLRPLGQAEYRFWGQPMYEARLLTPGAAELDWTRPLGLELEYARSFDAGVLVWSSLVELRRLEGTRPDHDAFEAALSGCFASVSAGDSYLALATSADDLGFFLNGDEVCAISGDRWAERFLAIWLSEDSRDPASARALLGADR
jgi:hypothetical protein